MNERDIFHAAMELTDPGERSAYLEQACGGDASLQQHVEGMLQVCPELGTFLESPAFPLQGVAVPPVSAGRFQVGHELARGGMGVIYCARDHSLGRDVAVKILHERYQVDSLVGQRFLDEARITAQLQHPAIPPVFEVGRLDDGRPYLAMKLIKGRTLENLLKERPEPASDRGRFLAAFQQVCQAVGYAHNKHILHRDLKPANVMVGAFGEVQVMDWGLAKLMPPGGAGHESATAIETSGGTVIEISRPCDSGTLAGSMLGTPAFMAPEQAGGELDRLDKRTDVFGLGAILCVILTGEPPYTGKSGEDLRLMAIRGKLAEAEARLEQCGADRKLVELCRACLSAEREDRPRDAGAVAAAVAGYLAGVEERARQAEVDRAAAEVRSAEQRKRRRVQLTLAATILLALVGGMVATAWQALRATQAESDALSKAERNRRLLYSADVHLASQVWQSEEGTVSQCKELLLAHVPAPGQLDLREFCWRYQWRLLHRESGARLPVVPSAAGITADGRVITLDSKGNVNAWPIDDPTKREALTLGGEDVLGVTLARNGEVAAVIDRDGSAKVFDARTGAEKLQIRTPSPLVNLKLSGDGRFLVGVGRDKHARVWDSASGKELYNHLMIDPTAKQIDLSLNGKQILASWGDKGTLVVLYRAGQEKPMVLHPDGGGFDRLQGALSPDGTLAAVPHHGNHINLYDTTTGKSLRFAALPGRGEMRSRSPAVRVAFSPDGSQLAVGEWIGLVTLWSLPRPVLPAGTRGGWWASILTVPGRPVPRRLQGHQAAIEALAFTADGRKLVSISRDNTARCWDAADQEESRVLLKGRDQIDALGYSPDGRYLAESSMSNGIHVHDLTATGAPFTLTTRPSRRAVFSPDGRIIAGGPDHRLTLWDAKTKDLLCTLTEPKLADKMGDPNYQSLIQDMGAEIGALAFSPDSRWLAVGIGGPFNYSVDLPQKVMVFDVAQRKEHRTFATPTQVNAVAFSADGKLLAAAGHDGTIWLWDTSSWEEIARWQGPARARYGAILFVPAGLLGEAGPRGGRPGELLAIGSTSGTIDLWDVSTKALARQMHGHIGLISVMVLSPDGRTLASASADGSIKLWDIETGRELRTLYRQDQWMYALAFSPDGNTLASGGLSPLLRLWEASSKEAVAADLAPMGLQPKTSRP
jgi:WD40 repeat protein